MEPWAGCVADFFFDDVLLFFFAGERRGELTDGVPLWMRERLVMCWFKSGSMGSAAAVGGDVLALSVMLGAAGRGDSSSRSRERSTISAFPIPRPALARAVAGEGCFTMSPVGMGVVMLASSLDSSVLEPGMDVPCSPPSTRELLLDVESDGLGEGSS